ncbi:MAG: TerC family protein [Verrucomicrobia bacterium]|nr:TerC family protein [Verrucomicrobiota bacterium]
MGYQAAFWIGFHVLIAVLLSLDLGLFHRKGHVIKFREACLFSAFWIVVALLFNLFVYYSFGPDVALQFFTGYLIEKSLSVDNLFLFLIIFMHFRTPPLYQHKILFLGILGTLLFRISLILLGVSLIEHFHWMYYVFGAFLLASGIKFMLQKAKDDDLSKSALFRVLKKVLPVANEDGDGEFFVKRRGYWKVTTLFLTLLMIECTDIILALDSIPAIFAITTDPFIVYTSNVFAILGLRSLYFVLAASLKKMRYLKFGLAAILVFVGLKMLLANVVQISVPASLGVILLILSVTMLASLKLKKS